MAVSTVLQFYNGSTWASEDGGYSGRYYNRGGGTQSACISGSGRTASAITDSCAEWNGTSWSATAVVTTAGGEGCGNGNPTSAIMGPSSADQDASCSYNGVCWSTNPAFLYNSPAAAVIGNGERAIIGGGGQGVPPGQKSSYWDGTSYAYANDVLAGNTHLVGIGTLGRGGGAVGSSYFIGLESPTVKFVGV